MTEFNAVTQTVYVVPAGTKINDKLGVYAFIQLNDGVHHVNLGQGQNVVRIHPDSWDQLSTVVKDMLNTAKELNTPPSKEGD